MSEENKNTNQEIFSLEEFYIELPGGGLIKTKLKSYIDAGEGENSIVQKMEEGADPNIAKGKNDVAFGRFVEVDSRIRDENGKIIDPGSGAFSHGIRNKNYGDCSAQFGAWNENYSTGGFQAGYNQLAKPSQYIAQFGNGNFTDKNSTAQFGSGNEAGRTGQVQFGNYSKGSEDNLLEVGNGRYFYKANFSDISQILGKYYIDSDTKKYVEITEENKQEIWDKLLVDDKYKVYERKNAFEIKEDGSAELEKQGQSENSILLNKTFEDYKENDAYVGTEGLVFEIIDEEKKTCGVRQPSKVNEKEKYNLYKNQTVVKIPPYVFINNQKYTVVETLDSFRASPVATTIDIPMTVTKLGRFCFNNTSLVLSNIIIPSSVVEVGSALFNGNRAVTEIEIPDSVTTFTNDEGVSYPKYIFSGCTNVKKITLGKGITSFPYGCFNGCKSLTDLIIRGNITTIYNKNQGTFTGTPDNLTIWVPEDLLDYYINLFKTQIDTKENRQFNVKPYRDELELNEYLNSKTHTTVIVNGEEVTTFDADTKLDKVTSAGGTRAYTISPSGGQSTMNIASAANNSTIPIRTNEGVLKGKTPTEGTSDDLTNRKYVDEIAATKLDKQIPTDYTSVPTIATDGTQGLVPVISGYPNPNTIPKRGISGEILVVTHSAGGDFTATNKKYVHDLFNGANKAVSFINYSSMITSLNALDNTAYSVGQNVMIVTLEVPDLWVSEITEESVSYEYVSDDDFTTLLETQGYVQVGYYKLSALETQKVDLTEYATNEALDDKVDKIDETLVTESKEVVGAINELVDTKLERFKRTSGAWLYGENSQGVFYNRVATASTVTTLGSIPQYRNKETDSGEAPTEPKGVLITNDPIQPYHSANKKYVDEIVDTKVNKTTESSYYQRLYGVNASGEQKIFEIPGSRAAAINGRIPQYYANDFGDDTLPSGVLITGMPTKGCHATPKNYVDDRFNGANKAVSFNNYSEMITNLLAQETASYSIGQNIMIVTLNVPDLWVSGVVDENNSYEYSSDEAFLQDLKDYGSVPVGHYYLSALETQKVDLTDYVKLSATQLEDGSYSLTLVMEE